jgi:hypothetical protein
VGEGEQAGRQKTWHQQGQRDPAKSLQRRRPEVFGCQFEAGVEVGQAGLESESRVAQAEEAVGEQPG